MAPETVKRVYRVACDLVRTAEAAMIADTMVPCLHQIAMASWGCFL